MSTRDFLSGLVLSFRYRVSVRGVREVAQSGNTGILFLPNHPALIDPVILMTALYSRFRPRALGDRDQIDRFFVRSVARHLRVIQMPDLMVSGPQARHEVDEAIRTCGNALREGDNLVLYPSGNLQTGRRERLGAASAVSSVVAAAPDCRIVMVRISGLWGSRFGWACGRRPEVGPVLWRGALAAVASGFFFMPRRKVEIELIEPVDFPREASREQQNRYIEEFFNAKSAPALAVPMTPWVRGGARRLPEPALEARSGSIAQVSDELRQAVQAHLCNLSGVDQVSDTDHLIDDLMMDSLQRAEIAVWLEEEFGAPRGALDSLLTVDDVVRIAGGYVDEGLGDAPLAPVPPGWFHLPPPELSPRFEVQGDLVDSFLAAARSAPTLPILADQTAGLRTYRQLLTGIAALQPTVSKLEGDRVGMMLPATVGADVVYLALLFSGKTPVMVNWTAGTRNLRQGLDDLGVRRILTARALVDRLEDQGVDLDPLLSRFVFLEDVVAAMGTSAKIRALVKARLRPDSLKIDRPDSTAVILFTSGSESVPKAVPLSDENILTNLKDIFSRIEFERGDRLLSVLPPFHSFGLTAGVLMPLLGRIPTVHYPVPTDGPMLARMVETYEVTLMGGTPTFLAGMVRGSEPGQLDSLRLAVTGGESFPAKLWTDFASCCPGLMVLEGYGITECSPIVSINSPGDRRTGTVGRPLPSVRHRVVEPGKTRQVTRGAVGELLVSGPSIFAGYLSSPKNEPFVEVDGRTWYRTGDLVAEDEAGFLVFAGRLKRFIKLAGEMVSLPAIEEVLLQAFESAAEDGPLLAVEASSDGFHPEIVLFTTGSVDRAAANRAIREAGLSPLHAVRHAKQVAELPLLGTGKIDYRTLREWSSGSVVD